MTWSYSGDPASSSKDKVRFLIGDTDTAMQLVQDQEIGAILAMQSNAYRAAARVARAIAAKFARQVDVTGEGLAERGSQRARAFRDLADELDATADAEGPQVPIARPRIHGYATHDIFTEADTVPENELRDSA